VLQVLILVNAPLLLLHEQAADCSCKFKVGNGMTSLWHAATIAAAAGSVTACAKHCGIFSMLLAWQ
jgi:hypothetical protein